MWQKDLYGRWWGPGEGVLDVNQHFWGVRIVQEQQAHSSSGRSERSSLMMISIIQAICANRRRVFIRLLESTRLAAREFFLNSLALISFTLLFTLKPTSEMTTVLCLYCPLFKSFISSRCTLSGSVSLFFGGSICVSELSHSICIHGKRGNRGKFGGKLVFYI